VCFVFKKASNTRYQIPPCAPLLPANKGHQPFAAAGGRGQAGPPLALLFSRRGMGAAARPKPCGSRFAAVAACQSPPVVRLRDSSPWDQGGGVGVALG
jgi:hypothetical protein